MSNVAAATIFSAGKKNYNYGTFVPVRAIVNG